MAVTINNLINRVNAVSKGEYEDIVENSDDWRTLLEIINHQISLLFSTPYTNWRILYDINYYANETVSISKTIYTLDDITDRVVDNSVNQHIYFTDNAGKIIGLGKLVDTDMYASDTSANIATVVGEELHVRNISPSVEGTRIRIPVYNSTPQYKKGSNLVSSIIAPWLIEASAAAVCDTSPVPFIARNNKRHAELANEILKRLIEINNSSQKPIIRPIDRVENNNIPMESLGQALFGGR